LEKIREQNLSANIVGAIVSLVRVRAIMGGDAPCTAIFNQNL